MPVVYILRCSDGTFYVGHTDRLPGRLQAHNAGTGSTDTTARRPVFLVYREAHTSLESAVARERQLKRWTAAKKEALVAGNLASLKRLSTRHPR